MSYTKTNWQNLPNTTTPLNANNLNHIEQGIYDNDSNITTNATNIANLTTALNTQNTYSTSEVQVGTWIDNKPIYRKVVTINSLPNNDYTNISHNISNLGEVIRTSAIMRNNYEALFAPLNLQELQQYFQTTQ